MFNIESVKNLVWDNVEHSSFSCIVKYQEFNEEFNAGVNAADPYAHIQELWVKGSAGEYGEIAEYIPPEIPPLPEPKVETELTEGILPA
jgi:hypothetical protein